MVFLGATPLREAKVEYPTKKIENFDRILSHQTYIRKFQHLENTQFRAMIDLLSYGSLPFPPPQSNRVKVLDFNTFFHKILRFHGV